LYRGASALAHIGCAETEVNTQYPTNRAQHKQRNTTLNPDAVEQLGVGKRALRRRKQRDADLSPPSQSNQRGHEQGNASGPENTNAMHRLHDKIVIPRP
jgi:hypothetical protein